MHKVIENFVGLHNSSVPLATQGAITRDGIGAAAGINVVNGVTNNAVGNASVAANQNQPTTVTQMNVPVDIGINDTPREDAPEGLMVDVCVEEVVIENSDNEGGGTDTRTTQRQVISCGFASTLAITTAGTGLSYLDPADNTEKTDGSFTNAPVSCINPEDTRANDRIEYEILTVDFTLTGGVSQHVPLTVTGYAYADGATLTIDNLDEAANPGTAGHVITRNERANARGQRWQNGDVFRVNSQDGPLQGFDGPIFQIVDDTFAYPYRPAGWIDLKVVTYGREYRVDLKDEDNDLLHHW